MPAISTNTVNFEFLAQHNPVLTKLAALAERFVFEDPNTALIKIRQLAETIAKGVALQNVVGKVIASERRTSESDITLWLHSPEDESVTITAYRNGD